MKKLSLNATTLRLSLSISLFLIAILGAVGGYFMENNLRSVAIDVSHSVIDANASQDTIQTLQKVKQELNDDKDIIDRTRSIVADSQSYQYQDQIVTDLNDYANRSGVSITNIDFSAADTKSTSTPSPTPKTQPTLPVPAGVKSTSVSVSLKNPVDYYSLLRFIKSIEQNLTKMQISRISLTKDPSSNGVTSETLNLEVYVR